MNAANARRHDPPPRQRGAALVIGLILLLVLTLLAISGMNTATLELQMAGNEQNSQSAFQAAETGIEVAVRSGAYNTNAASNTGLTTIPGSSDTYEAATQFDLDAGITPVPSGGFSMGAGTGFQAYHFNVNSAGRSTRGALSTHTQSFYVVGPSGN